MAMKHQRKERLKPLLDKVPPGYLVDTPWLRAQGADPKSIHGYVSRGWLERVIRGVYRRPLSEGMEGSAKDSWQAVLLSLQRILGHDIHLGGESVLDLTGYTHYLSFGNPRRVHFYGLAPAWLKRLPVHKQIILHSRTLFKESQDDLGEISQGMWQWPIEASSPEQAILEALDELPNHASFSNLDKIFEGLTTLRPNRLMKLLEDCRSIKVRRLFFVFADRHQHSWRKHLDTSRIDFGSGPRALTKGGKIHPEYHISVPRNLVPMKEQKGHVTV